MIHKQNDLSEKLSDMQDAKIHSFQNLHYLSLL